MNKRYFSVLIISMAAPVIGAAAMLAVGILDKINNESVRSTVALTIGIVFWVSILIQASFLTAADMMRRKDKDGGCYEGVGLVRFFSCTEAVIADICMILFAAAVALIAFCGVRTSWIILTSVSLLYISFNLHCYLNGKNYRYIKQKKYERER